METDFQIQCPYCGEFIWMEFYPEDGLKQDTIIDCEVCCRPISLTVQFSESEDPPYLDVRRSQ
ncbi:MAG: CPXCG motif-containing cysteine-rich protein [Halobacteriovoraceae bacterium]|nr:CPXCG motif-containing cysteine-rich protein [Halobacteriovoraceae bacterium]MCB9095288.1 CPXCG motif-containing cysteine-rich protein [Halobacteriovoraceae bacterium]